jgi:CubicO group peptidase (beta-lactamase class C family)
MSTNTENNNLSVLKKRTAFEQGLRYKVLLSNKSNKSMHLLERMAHYNVHGVSIAVIKDGAIEWAHTYGIADTETREQLTINTLFQAGSISKSITALGVLRLVQQNLVSLDKDINLYLKSWQLPNNEFTKNEKVTLRKILSHTAGLTVSGFPGYPVGSVLPSIVQVLDGVKPPANTDPVRVARIPGTKWSYSGGGTTIVQLLIEDITGQPFQTWMKQNVLHPLGMTLSTFNQPPNKQYNIASGHDQYGECVNGKYHLYPEMAAAGLWSTATDLAKFVIYIQNGFSNPDLEFLTSDLIKTMLQPQINAMANGLGTVLQNLNNEVVFEHDGQDHGFIARYRGLVQQKLGFVMMMNAYENGWYLMEEIGNSIADVYGWRHFSPTCKNIYLCDKNLYNKFEGVYTERENNREIVIQTNGECLFLKESPAMPKIKLYSESNHCYFTLEANHYVEFSHDTQQLLMKNSYDEGTVYYKQNINKTL